MALRPEAVAAQRRNLRRHRRPVRECHRPHQASGLKPAHLYDMQLLKRDGTPIAPGTARTTRRLLKTVLQTAVEIELVPRNVAAIGKPVAAGKGKVDTLDRQGNYAAPRSPEGL